jgi:hypothetical protein
MQEIERAIDNMIRRGDISDDNIRQAVHEITDLYYGKRDAHGDH